MLIGNRSVLLKSPGRWLNGNVGIMRSAFAQHGMVRNAFQSFDAMSSIPAGYRPSAAWIMAKTDGGLSSRNDCTLAIDASAEGAEGYGISGEASSTIDASGIGGLIAGGVGAATITLTPTGSVTATIGSTGTATINMAGAASIGALGWVVGSAPLTISGTLTPYAIGHMTGTTAESGLSNAGIANSVWARVIEAGFSAEQVLRLLAAQSVGSATGLEGSNPQFVGLDGVTVRIDGSYIAGTRTIDTLNGD